MTYDGVYCYYYDCENRLTDVNNTADAKVASFKYDYRGRRVKKVVYGNPDVVNIYLYDGDQIIRDFNEAGSILRMYYYGPGIDEPICMTIGTSSIFYYYHFDGLGSVVALSNDNGQIVEKYTYDVFGRPTIRDANNSVVSVSSVANRFMFTGREFEPETGMYYYRARYYQPSVGRFLQADPIGYKGGLNLYTYVRNNPINRKDPSGLADIPWAPPGGEIGPPLIPRWERDYPSLSACMGDAMSPLCSSLWSYLGMGGLGGVGIFCPPAGVIGGLWALWCSGEAIGAHLFCTELVWPDD